MPFAPGRSLLLSPIFARKPGPRAITRRQRRHERRARPVISGQAKGTVVRPTALLPTRVRAAERCGKTDTRKCRRRALHQRSVPTAAQKPRALELEPGRERREIRQLVLESLTRSGRRDER